MNNTYKLCSLLDTPYFTTMKMVDNITNTDSTLSPSHDINIIDGIKIHTKHDLNNFETFKINYAYATIWEIPFSLLIKLSKIIKDGDYNIIMFPKNIYSNVPSFNGFSSYLLYNHVCYKLTTKNNKHILYSTIHKHITIKNDLKNQYMQDNKNKDVTEIINNYDHIPFTHEKYVKIPNYKYTNTNGIFIRTNKKLNHIKMYCNGFILFDYCNEMINIAGNIIYQKYWTMQKQHALIQSLKNHIPMDTINEIIKHVKDYEEYFYWIPLSPYNKWSMADICNLNLSRMNNVTIEFDKAYDGDLYVMHQKMLKYKDTHLSV